MQNHPANEQPLGNRGIDRDGDSDTDTDGSLVGIGMFKSGEPPATAS